MTQFTRFGVVGLGGLVVDVAVFNILRITVLSPEVVHEGPVHAKIISTSLAIIANWIGNRYWAFEAQRRSHPLREGIEFAIVSVGGMLIGLGCLWVSHYALGFTSLLADNIALNVVGLVLGAAFRFTFYKLWVFRPPAATLDEDTAAPPVSSLDPAYDQFDDLRQRSRNRRNVSSPQR